jgi:hypothetical protein
MRLTGSWVFDDPALCEGASPRGNFAGAYGAASGVPEGSATVLPFASSQPALGSFFSPNSSNLARASQDGLKSPWYPAGAADEICSGA